MRAAWLAVFAALAPFQQSLALLDLLIAQRHHSGFSTCSLFTPPAPSAHPYLATCGLSLVNTNSSEVLVQALGCAEGEGARPNSTGLIADHGRDFFILELSRGGRVRTRLGGRHVGQGRYLFPEWNHVSPGAWNATFLLWATARRDLLQGALAHAPEDAVVEAGKQVQQRSPAAEPRQQPHRLPPGFNALLHTNYLWQLQHWYVETTPRRPPVLTAQLHKGGQEDGRSPLTVAAGNPQPRTSLSMLSSEAGAAGKSSASASALLKQHRQHQHQQHQRLTSSRRRHAHRRRLQESAGAGGAGGDGAPTSTGMAAAAPNPSMSTQMHNSSRGSSSNSSSSSAGCSSSKPTTISRPLCTAGAAKGEWVRLPEGARDCPPGVCRGPLSPLLYGSPDNVAMDFHDVYVPYSCRYRLYTPDEAAACLSATRLVVLGDSRAHELQWYLSMHYPGVHAHHHLLLPYRVGIRALLAAEAAALDSRLEAAALGGGAGGGDGGGPSAGTAQQQAFAGTTTAPAPLPTLRELMSGYDVLVLSSELHDIADYEHAAADYLQPYGLDPGPPGLRVSVAAATNSTNNTTHNTALPNSLETHPSSKGRAAEALHPGGAPVGAQCAPDTPERAQLPKWRPVAQYLDALSELVTRYQELRAELQQAGLLRVRRVLWLLPGYRPAATPTCLPNQLERMLCLQEWEVAQVAGRAGWEVLDMGTMAQDGPAAWWSDDVHVSGARSGRKRTHSGLQVMQLQALFNVLCNPQQE